MIRTRKKRQLSKVPRARTRRTRRHARRPIYARILFLLLVLAYCAVLLWTLFLWDGARITQIVVTGTERVDPIDIQERIQKTYSGTMWRFFPRMQYVLMRPRDIAQTVRDMSGVIRDVDVTMTFPHTLNIDIKEWRHVYIWCMHTEGKCYLLEDNGQIGREVADNDKIVRDNPVTRIEDIGTKTHYSFTQKNAITPSFLNALFTILKNNGIPLKEDVITVPHRRAQELSATTKEGWILTIAATQPLTATIRVIKSVLSDGITSQERERLVALDARLVRKIFYRVRGDDGEEEEKESNNSEDGDIQPLDE